MGTLIDRFEGHDGPVRGVDFHKTQPLFVSCGDDYTVKVWSLQSRKCLFTLSGHLDYVRTVFFHKDLPWIISASDDQTIRIWNWQNRQEIACLTGHNHYVMSAQFHPNEDLIVSASLDQTVRVWDISGLRQKHSAPGNTYENQMSRMNAPQQDIFGNTDAIVKFVLEGHDRGVNWASFHPTMPLIASAGDDRIMKIWRMSDTKAWEVESFRGHVNNILCCQFHPFQDLIISVSEDKTIRTWDINKRTGIQQFKRENDKFWYVVAHSEINLFAAAHDSGVMVFKLDRERPAFSLHQNTLFYIDKEKQLKSYEIGNDSDNRVYFSLQKFGNAWSNIRNISYNPSDKSILATTRSENNDGDIYQLITLPKDYTNYGIAMEPTGTLSGTGDQALFISRNRFAVFNKSAQTIDIKDLRNSVTKTVKLPVQVKDIAAASSAGHILLLCASSVVLYDLQQKKVLHEVPANGVKYVSWSNDGKYVALLGKHTITIASHKLEIIASLHETIRIKSAIWDDNGVLLYSTLNHLKYSLLNGDHGILKTLENTVYLVRVQGAKVYALARGGSVEVIPIDPTEYRFKKALLSKNFNEVLRIIKNSQLVGQSIISYLQQKGYPEVALKFVEDPQTRFDLAIECGNLEIAEENARIIDKTAIWKTLGDEALDQGNHQVAELAYQKLSQFDKLSFLYLVTGDNSKLEKMSQIAAHRGDVNARFTSSVYLDDAEIRINVLRDSGMSSLAYALAKSKGLDELAQSILEENGIEESQVVANISDTSSADVGIPVVNDISKTNWPLKSSELSFFEQAILGQVSDLSLEEAPEKDEEQQYNDAVAEDFEDEEGEVDEGGWGFDGEDLEIEDAVETEDVSTQDGVPEVEYWIRNSPIAGDHIAAGSFESAAQILNRTVGVVNFSPLKQRFMEVYKGSKLYLKGNEELESIPYYIRRNVDESNYTRGLPYVPGESNLKDKLQEAYKAIKSNKLEAAIDLFRELIYTIITLAVSDKEQESEAKRILDICKVYILAFSIEIERRSLPSTDVKRRLELAAYFTKPKLEKAHAHLALNVAMRESFSQKNYASASTFATKYLEIAPSGQFATTAKKIKAKADQQPVDAIKIEFDHFEDFEISPASFTPIYNNLPSVTDPLTGAKYHASEKGQICSITKISEVGAGRSGLRLAL